MVEGVYIEFEGGSFNTRLHEHGLQPVTKDQPPALWLSSGYLEGRPEELQALLKTCPTTITLKRNGVTIKTLRGCHGLQYDHHYDDVAILHLYWHEGVGP